jgi:hypothetical protein
VVSFRFSPHPLLLPFPSVALPHRSPACAAARTRRRRSSDDQKPAALVPPGSPWPPGSIPHHRVLQFAENQRIRTWFVSSGQWWRHPQPSQQLWLGPCLHGSWPGHWSHMSVYQARVRPGA